MALAGLCLAAIGNDEHAAGVLVAAYRISERRRRGGRNRVINSVANIGGFLGPMILGQFGLWAMATILVVGAVLVMFVRRDTKGDTFEAPSLSPALID